MHKSRLGTIVIDCRTPDLDGAAGFWSAALGRSVPAFVDPDASNYRELEGPDDELKILVQAVEHPSRVHLDIETDDIEAEVARLEKLGAKPIEFVRERWWVMEAPSGHRFCVVPMAKKSAREKPNVWP